MQTFLPYSDFTQTASVLDRSRLGKQRVEAWQVLQALLTGKGWVHHPTVKQWRGYEAALSFYGRVICQEWLRRGYKDTMLERFSVPGEVRLPPWLGNEAYHASHRSALQKPCLVSTIWVDRASCCS